MGRVLWYQEHPCPTAEEVQHRRTDDLVDSAVIVVVLAIGVGLAIGWAAVWAVFG